MKYVAALAIMAGMLAVPAFGQHMVARGGPVPHAGGAPHGFSGAAPHAFSAPAPRSFGHGFSGTAIGMRPGGSGPRAPLGFRPLAPRFSNRLNPVAMRPGAPVHARAPYRRFGAVADERHPRGPHGPREPHDWNHHHHRGVYWNGGVYPYVYWYPPYPIFTGYVDPWLFGPDDYDYDQHQSAADYGAYPSSGPAQQGQDAESSAVRPDGYATQQAAGATRQPYSGSSGRSGERQSPGQSAAGAAATTVIFKDGRPPEQIHNYLMTADTLTVLDGRYLQIPLAEVDMAATEAANRAAGVAFTPPQR